MMKKTMLIVLMLLTTLSSFAQGEQKNKLKKTKERGTHLFVAYDLGEMAFNKFRNFGGEIGLRFKNKHMFRFVYSNVKLTEEHLSSNFAKAVDGENVEGLFIDYELFYDIPVFKNFYIGASVGYNLNRYNHTILDASLKHQTPSLGLGFSYRETNVFNVKGLYYNLCVPIRYNFNAQEEAYLGETRINKNVIGNNIWFLIGYEF